VGWGTTNLKKLGTDKHSSLFCRSASDKEKKFYNIETLVG
jgi:hypothetical protein